MMNFRSSIVSARRFFGSEEKTKAYFSSINMDLCAPLIGLTVPVNSPKPTGIIASQSGIHPVLRMITASKIGSSIIKTVVIFMVDFFRRFAVYDESVHPNPFVSFASAGSPVSIKSFRRLIPKSTPIPPVKRIKISGIDDSVFILRQWNKAVRWILGLFNRVSFHAVFHVVLPKGLLKYSPILALLAVPLHAQTFPTAPIHGPGPPINPCSNGVLYTDTNNGNLWSCQAGVWTNSTSTNATKPAPATPVRYVAQKCSGNVPCADTNDGLSLGTAKATPYAAILTLPEGSGTSSAHPQAGFGTVYIANDYNGLSFGGPGGNCGWYMFGPGDPNYTTGKTCWMQAPSNGNVSLVCAGGSAGPADIWGQTCQEFWGRFDPSGAAVWMSNVAGLMSLHSFSFNYMTHPIILGIDSNGNRTNGGSSSLWLDHDAVNTGGCSANAGNGPGVDIGNNTFWIKINDGSYSGCPAENRAITSISRTSGTTTAVMDASVVGDFVAGANNWVIIRNVSDQSFNGAYPITSVSGSTITYTQTGSPNVSAITNSGQAFPYGAAAIGINAGNSNGAGFIYLQNVGINSGTVWAQGGPSSGYGLIADHIVYEGNFSSSNMSAIELLPNGAGGIQAFINDVEAADTSVSVCGVESLGFGVISAQNANVCGNLNTPFGQYTGTSTVSPLRQGIYGFINGMYVGPSNAARRTFAPVAVDFTNIAGANTTWQLFSATQANSILAPDGTSQASRLTATGGGAGAIVAQQSATPNVGDTYMGGVWVHVVSGGNDQAVSAQIALNGSGLGAGNYCAGGYYNSALAPAQTVALTPTAVFMAGDGEWRWFGGACTILSGPSSGFINLNVNFGSTAVIDVYGPVLKKIPAGTLSANEIAERLLALQSFPAAALAGDVAMMPGQRLLLGIGYPATGTIASGTAALGTSSISTGACATVVTVAATGVLSTDNIQADFNSDPTGITGYNPATALLTIIKYPTSGNVNFKVCNLSGSSVTPGAVTLNWRVVR